MTAVADATMPVGSARPAAVRWRDVAVLVIRLVLGFVFLLSAATKLGNPYAFLGIVHGYEVVGTTTARSIAVGLPFAELALGGCLIAGVALRTAFTLSGVLLLVFVAALASVVWRGLDVPCGCFGVTATSPVTWATVARTSLLAGMAVMGLCLFVRTRPGVFR